MLNKQDDIQRLIKTELDRIADQGPMLKGTISEVCRGERKTGTGERTAYLLTYKGKHNKTKTVYVPVNRISEAKSMIAKYHEAKNILEGIVDLSVKLFKNR